VRQRALEKLPKPRGAADLGGSGGMGTAGPITTRRLPSLRGWATRIDRGRVAAPSAWYPGSARGAAPLARGWRARCSACGPGVGVASGRRPASGRARVRADLRRAYLYSTETDPALLVALMRRLDVGSVRTFTLTDPADESASTR
jgi:hypothetical protein